VRTSSILIHLTVLYMLLSGWISSAFLVCGKQFHSLSGSNSYQMDCTVNNSMTLHCFRNYTLNDSKQYNPYIRQNWTTNGVNKPHAKQQTLTSEISHYIHRLRLLQCGSPSKRRYCPVVVPPVSALYEEISLQLRLKKSH